MKIIKDYLTEENYQLIFDGVYSKNFPWHRDKIISPSQLDEFPLLCHPRHNFQFTHIMYAKKKSSKHIAVIKPFLERLEATNIRFIKLNYNYPTDEVIEHCYHVDILEPYKVGVYYLNTTDGYTKFRNGCKVSGEKNKFVTFDSSEYHTGTSCTTPEGRIVLNVIYN